MYIAAHHLWRVAAFVVACAARYLLRQLGCFEERVSELCEKRRPIQVVYKLGVWGIEGRETERERGFWMDDASLFPSASDSRSKFKDTFEVMACEPPSTARETIHVPFYSSAAAVPQIHVGMICEASRRCTKWPKSINRMVWIELQTAYFLICSRNSIQLTFFVSWCTAERAGSSWFTVCRHLTAVYYSGLLIITFPFALEATFLSLPLKWEIVWPMRCFYNYRTRLGNGEDDPTLEVSSWVGRVDKGESHKKSFLIKITMGLHAVIYCPWFTGSPAVWDT